MASLDLVDQLVIAENPWADTQFGTSSHYVRSRARGGPSDAQLQQQERFANARQQVAGNCSGQSGMARATCIAREMSQAL